MKTVFVLASLVAIALAGAVPHHHDVETKSVDNEFIAKQKKVFYLYEHVTETIYDADYYKIGKEFNLEASADLFTNKKAFEEFWFLYKDGMLHKNLIFSVFYDRMREEAIALYHIFYYAKDFETFYKTACWARVHLNEGLFVYAFNIAIMHREDCKGIIQPAPYEVYPYYFVNADVIGKLYRIKMQEGFILPEYAAKYGIYFQDNTYVIHANYSGWSTFDNEEQKLTYFTEDIGLNTYYYYFHTFMPFWMSGESVGYLKERRGEYYFYFYQQLLARYYMERLTNGLGEIPEFSWRYPFITGYTPNMVCHNLFPFVHRNNYYHLQEPENRMELEYLESYEKQFLHYLEQGFFKGYNYEVDFKNFKSVNFVGNYWNSNYDLYEKFGPRNYEQYYEIIARVLLGAGAEPKDEHYVAPVILEHFETALRDPAFYQLYKRIMYYFLQYKQYLEPYPTNSLKFDGVKINEVHVDQLVTYFDYYNFDAYNAVFHPKNEHKTPYSVMIRQPRINNKPFDVKVDIESTVATDVIVKFFLAPKYDNEGFPISLEDNWMNFYELDMFKYKLTAGKNSIVRNSEHFTFFKEDSVPTYEIFKMMESGKVPHDMSEDFYLMPYRLMLPKGTKGGFPFQFFCVVYPYVSRPDVPASEAKYIQMVDTKPFGYPFDRPVNDAYFYNVHNMYFKDVHIYHEGEDFAYFYNIPGYKVRENTVPKQ